MAPKQSEEKQRLDRDSEKAILHDFVYRDDMSLNEVAEYLEKDWDNAYDWAKEQLKRAKDDEK